MSASLLKKLLTAVLSNEELKTELINLLNKYNVLSEEELTQLKAMKTENANQLMQELEERVNKGHHAGI